MDISPKGLALTKEFEGCRLEAYKDVIGKPTIGYGHTKGVKMGDKITQEQADHYLLEDMGEAIRTVNEYVKVPITQGMFDAMCDFVFNLGYWNFVNSTLLRALNERYFDQAAYEFLKWNHAGGKEVEGLTRRCQARKALFESK